MKKLIALMCVGALALAGVNGLEAKTKVKKSRKVAKTEMVKNEKVACDKAKADCKDAKDCDKAKAECKDAKDCDKAKFERKDFKKVEGKDLKKTDAKACDKAKADCNNCAKKAEGGHKCAHKNPCCKDGACKMDGSCGKEKCKAGSEACCK